MAGLGALELLIIGVVLIALFGASRLPKLARSVGEARGEFRKAMDDEPPG